MTAQNFSTCFRLLQEHAKQTGQRRLLVLQGSISWALSLMQSLKNGPFDKSASPADTQEHALVTSWQIYSDLAEVVATVNRKNYRHKLGSECRHLVFIDSEFNLDALAALAGTLAAGGILILVWPDDKLDDSRLALSPFLQRLKKKIDADPELFLLQEGLEKYPEIKPLEPLVQSNNRLPEMGCITEEQYNAVQAVIKVAKGHRNRPLILTADRGRGKSSALAIAAAELLQSAENQLRIIITAPHSQALEVFFAQLKQSLPEASFLPNKVCYRQNLVEYIPVDRLSLSLPDSGLLLVDEAAAIPVYLLEQFSKHYHRIVFSSTQHGYEGAGRGFTLKFQRQLSLSCPNWRQYHIHQPIRWCENDPLERFIFETCLLNAELPELEIEPAELDIQALSFIEHKPHDLKNDETLLAELFAVLVTAHYQTSPSDLKMLQDNSQIRLVSLSYKNEVIAVALLMVEGQCSSEELTAVKKSERRLRNQFLPQSLLTQCGIKTAFNHNYLRVMRIAVHPQYQSLGIGSIFLEKIKTFAAKLSFDFVGTSFGVNPSLLKFWLNADYHMARVGFTRDKASGEYSALLLQPLTDGADKLQQEITKEFYRSFDYLLQEEYQAMPAKLVAQILYLMPEGQAPELSAHDLASIEDFASKHRLYSTCVYSLHLWLVAHLRITLSDKVFPLISKVLQKKSNEELCRLYGFTGKKTINSYLVDYVAKHFATS